MTPMGATRTRTVIEPGGWWTGFAPQELWRYRDLLFIMTWRDVMVRYKQTVLGAAWALLQPVLTMLILNAVFAQIAHLPTPKHTPYPLFIFAALVPWSYFSYVLTHGSESLTENARLLTKVYFPRVIMPLASVLSGLVDFALSCLVLMLLMAFYHISLTPALLLAPLFVGLAALTAFSVGIWLSALNVQYRDVRYTIPFLAQVWLYASPVAYATNLVHGRWAAVYALNPMVGVIEGFRWSVLGIGTAPGTQVIPSLCVTLVLLATGLTYFSRMERIFADVV